MSTITPAKKIPKGSNLRASQRNRDIRRDAGCVDMAFPSSTKREFQQANDGNGRAASPLWARSDSQTRLQIRQTQSSECRESPVATGERR
jgi:hypothetical protein